MAHSTPSRTSPYVLTEYAMAQHAIEIIADMIDKVKPTGSKETVHITSFDKMIEEYEITDIDAWEIVRRYPHGEIIGILKILKIHCTASGYGYGRPAPAMKDRYPDGYFTVSKDQCTVSVARHINQYRILHGRIVSHEEYEAHMAAKAEKKAKAAEIEEKRARKRGTRGIKK